jgi:Tfp pilus assembly protein PilV
MKLFFRKFNKLNKGFTLVETLVAISIFTVSILGMLSVLASGISDTNSAKQKIVATYLAQEGIEYTRNQRDTAVLAAGDTPQDGWDTFKVELGGLEVDDPDYYPVDDVDFAGFTRTITAYIDTFGDDEVKISSTVSWTQGSGEKSVTFSEHLFNWIE